MRAVATSRGVPADVLLRRLKVANKQVSVVAQTHDSGRLLVAMTKGTKRTLDALMHAEAGHIHTHLRIL
jgi:hypothetical protein